MRTHIREEWDEHWCLPDQAAPECLGFTPNVTVPRASENNDDFLIDYFWKEHILSAMMSMNEQLSKMGMRYMMTVGMFFDAQQQLETQRLFQQKKAEANRDYHSSVGLCTMGTAAIGLPKTAMTSEFVAASMARRSLDRQMHASNTLGSQGASSDIVERYNTFRRRFCNPDDNNRNLGDICVGAIDPETVNKDVDFVRTLYSPLTVDIDLENTVADGDEADLFALTSNLFAHRIFSKVPYETLNLDQNKDEILDMRAVLAKRSVAEHSFYTIAGMKTSSTAALDLPSEHVAVVLQQLGMTYDEAVELLGENPSYWALMEVLSKSVYQSPRFYVNLYDKPANTLRKEAAIMAINSMQNMDRFKSQLRSESMLAVLVELELMDEQERVRAAFDAMRAEY